MGESTPTVEGTGFGQIFFSRLDSSSEQLPLSMEILLIRFCAGPAHRNARQVARTNVVVFHVPGKIVTSWREGLRNEGTTPKRIPWDFLGIAHLHILCFFVSAWVRQERAPILQLAFLFHFPSGNVQLVFESYDSHILISHPWIVDKRTPAVQSRLWMPLPTPRRLFTNQKNLIGWRVLAPFNKNTRIKWGAPQKD